MANPDNWKELCAELKHENEELREQLRVLGSNFTYMTKVLDAKPQPQEPAYVDDGVYECGKCYATLQDNWGYCPYCGSRIMWVPDDDGWRR